MDKKKKNKAISISIIHPTIHPSSTTIRYIPKSPEKQNKEGMTHLANLWKLSLRLSRERLKLGNQECTVLSHPSPTPTPTQQITC
jgi:hypothetical protein